MRLSFATFSVFLACRGKAGQLGGCIPAPCLRIASSSCCAGAGAQLRAPGKAVVAQHRGLKG